MIIKGYLWFNDEHIKIGFTEKDRKYVRKTSAALKKPLKSLSKYFRVEKNFGPIRAILVPNRKEYDRLVNTVLRVDIEKPSRPSRIAQTQRTDLVLLAPSAYAIDSIYEYSAKEYQRLVFHEMVHIFEEYLSPNIEALPRWWSEGLAVYLSEQWKYEDEFGKPVLKGLGKKIPGFKKIQKDVKLAYQWGWTIVKYIEYCYGQKMILTIVRNCTDGDVFKIMGETMRNFERKWKNHLENDVNFVKGTILGTVLESL